MGAMRLQELLDVGAAVRGASIARKKRGVLELVRERDGVRATVRFVSARRIGPYRPSSDTIAVVRWMVPRSTDSRAVGRLNDAATMAVVTTRHHGDLYGPRKAIYYRAQMLAQGLDAARFMKALAHDLELEDSIPAPTPVSLAEVEQRLRRAPVKTPEQRLGDALFGPDPKLRSRAYERRGDALVGPSSIGTSIGGAPPVELEVRVCALGLVRISHTRQVPAGADPHALADSISAEDSAQEELVTYHRAVCVSDGRMRVEATTSLSEIGGELFARKVRTIEIAVSAHLTPREPVTAAAGGGIAGLFDFFKKPS